MHRGGAFGGHYFAYIKSFENGNWYNFNDTKVMEIPLFYIKRHCFGGKGSESAYMLMYKKVYSSEKKFKKMNKDLIHQDIKKVIDEEEKMGVNKPSGIRNVIVNREAHVKVYHMTD